MVPHITVLNFIGGNGNDAAPQPVKGVILRGAMLRSKSGKLTVP